MRIWQKFSQSITGGAIIIGSASVVSRISGLARDNLFAKYFGADATLDAYNAAFKIPDLIFNILVLGALSASFIPVFIEVLKKYNQEQAIKTANAVLTLLVTGLGILIVIAYFLSPLIAEKVLMARYPVEMQLLTSQLMRIMLVSIIFFGMSNVFSGMLNSYRRFIAYSLAPICYNGGIILGIVYLSKIYGLPGLAYGVVLGAAMHFLVQLPAVLKIGWRPQLIFDFSLVGVKKILKLMPARSLALGIVQINALIIAALALRLQQGSLTIWTWADNLQQFPINVFGVSLAMSAFPVFSQAMAANDLTQFKKSFSINFRKILFLIIPVSIITLMLRAQIVRLILGSLGSGKFDWNTTVLTAQTLGFFSISLFAQASIPLLARSFFAHQNTKTPVIVSIISMLVNISLAMILSPYLGIYGLALAFSFSSLLNMLMLLTCLRVKFGDLEDQVIINSVWKIILASLFMGVVIHGAKYAIAPLVDMHTFIGIAIQAGGSALAGAIFYIAVAIYFRFSEVGIVREFLTKAKRLILNGHGQSQ